MRFKEGDKVVVREWDDMVREFGTNGQGEILTPLVFTPEMKRFCGGVFEISYAYISNYILEGNRYRYTDEMLMPFEFHISDLKDGMLCQMRDGEKMIWMYGKMRGITSFVDETYDDLKCHASCCDIVKVGYPSEKAWAIEGMLQMEFGKVIWVRKEGPTVKEFSIDEINKILKEKFPDVDEFKINTKE